jgi:hypothetical protein
MKWRAIYFALARDFRKKEGRKAHRKEGLRTFFLTIPNLDDYRESFHIHRRLVS